MAEAEPSAPSIAKIRPPLKCVVYGDAGGGKSTFAATWPKPMLVFAWDPMGKDIPYHSYGEVQPLERLEIGSTSVPVRRITNRVGKTLVQIEHYIDRDPRNPEAYSKFQARFVALENEYNDWRTVVFDSVTFMELMARKEHQYRLNPTTRNPIQWFAGSTDLLEEMLMIQVGALPMNVVVVSHIDEDKDEVNGIFVRNPKAPGRLGKGKGLAAAMVEVYRMHVARNDMGVIYQLQTQSDTMYNCATRIHAPNPCAPQYKALWRNGNA